MKPICSRTGQFLSLVILIILACSGGAFAQAVPQVKTDKNIYKPGETIPVTFTGAPGELNDWICIVPADSPDDEAGDFKYLSHGMRQGVLCFDPPAPGKYEVRAYYDYSDKGYTVSARHAFLVERGPEAGADERARRERKINSANPLPLK